MNKINWKEYADKVGIKSGNAYKKLFGAHSHPLSESGDDSAYVTMDDAIEAVKIAEKEIDDVVEKWIEEYNKLNIQQKKSIEKGEYLTTRVALNKLTVIKNMLKDLGYEIDF